MTSRVRCTLILVPVLAALVVGGCTRPARDARATLRVRNNHALSYDGPVQFRTEAPDGTYEGAASRGEVHAGIARVTVTLPARSEVVLSRTGPVRDASPHPGPLSVTERARRLELHWLHEPVGSLELGLVVVPGAAAEPDDAIAAFEPLDIPWTKQPDGVLKGTLVRNGYRLEVRLVPYSDGWMDMRTRLTRVQDAQGPAYVAVVRRVTAVSGVDSVRMRFNGRVLHRANSPDTWSRDFWYTRGVDWTSWKAGTLSMAAMSGFTPTPTIERDSVWVEGSHFYVWDRTRCDGNQLYLISEVSGPNPKQATSRYMRVTPYAPIRKGDTLELTWRLAVETDPARGWEDSQLRVFAGYQSAHRDSGVAVVDLGVRGVAFGTSYFPYSTLAENLDYYRTPGLDRETFWPFSATMWNNWRAFVPRMRTDLHIIRAMGFDWVRLHHLELLQGMERREALAFLDFYMGEARRLGLKVLIDTEGPAEWVTLIGRRYRDVIRRVEVENEVLIPGIGPGDAARWTRLYAAAKQADPEAQVFFTSAGNDGAFERLRTLGVPFDRVGLHAYKHGPEWKEALSSHALAAAGYARSLGKLVTLGEFNWKGLTRLSPTARQREFAATYEAMLEPRAIPEVFQFQFQETLDVNPSIGRSGGRHYETIALDRRPKPEALELMRLVREYGRPDAPVRAVPVTIREVQFVDGHATAPFTIANHTGHPLSLHLRALAFGGIASRLTSPDRVSLEPGEVARGSIALRLDPAARPGTYHHFLEVDYGPTAAYGWGIAAKPGAPVFETQPVLKGLVVYPQGADVVEQFDWTRPLAVAFGPKAPVLEVEMAYLVANTLQSATGRRVWLSSTADLPDSLAGAGNLILVGTGASNLLIAGTPRYGATEQGIVRLDGGGDDGPQRLLLTGHTSKAVEAAATDFVLRYWQNAKDAGLRITGMERGAALGDTARVTVPDPP